MLSSRILTRRLPQVAARFTAPRASFSQVRSLSAAEVDDPLQVCHLSAPRMLDLSQLTPSVRS